MQPGQISRWYGDPSARPPDWDDVDRRLAEARLCWMVTVRHDGCPHAVPLCGVWREGAFRGDGRGSAAHVYRFEPAKVPVFGDDHGQTTFRP